MKSSARDHSPRHAATALLGLLAAALCAGGVVVVAAASRHDQVDRAVLQAVIAGAPLAVGVYAMRSAHNARFGALLIGTSAIWSLTALGETSESLPYSVGRVSGWLILPVLIYLMLTFPDGRLGRGGPALYAATVGLISVLYVGSALFVEEYPTQTPFASCRADCPPNAFLVMGHEPAIMSSIVEPARELFGVVLLVGVGASLIHRHRVAGPLRRRTSGPLVATSVASLAVLVTYLTTRWAVPGAQAVGSLGTLWSLCIPAMAGAFLSGLLLRRLALGDVLATLSARLTGELDVPRMRSVLAAALCDPTVDLLLPDALPGRWRSSDGTTTSSAAVGAGGHAVAPVLDGGVAVALLVHDPTLREDDELLDAVLGLVGSALRHQQMIRRLATLRDQLEDSRRRIASAADVERSRIERDLHDGAQQRLIMLRIRLSLAEETLWSDPAAGAQATHELGAEVEEALDELRSLAHGVYPSLLTDRGLTDALRGALAQGPLPGHLHSRGVTRQGREVEAAVYFACLEAVQNAAKHAAGATGVWVSLRQNGALWFEVRDDGRGFVPPGPDCNGGLRNMRDRVETLGGRLTIDSAPGHGTRIRGTVRLT